MKRLAMVAAVAAAALLAACGQSNETAQNEAAPGATAETTTGASNVAEIIKTRQDTLEGYGEANRTMQDELKKSQPDLQVIRTNLQTIMTHAQELPGWFPEGSGPESGIETDAKPEIWAQPDVFRERHQAFMAEAQKFSATVESGNVEAIRTALPTFGQACRNCHMTFRVLD